MLKIKGKMKPEYNRTGEIGIIGDLKNDTNCTAVDCYLLKDHGTFHKKPRTSAYC